MRALIRKLWADLTGRAWQSALIALAMGAAAALLYLGLATLAASRSPYETQLARANGAHAWFYVKDEAAGRAAAQRIASRPGVTDSIQRPVARTYLLAPDAEKVPWMDLMPMPPGQPRLMGYILLEGRDLQPTDRGGALLAVSMARYLHVGPGDTVRVQTQDGPRQLQVVGLIAEPKSCTFPRCEPHSLYVLPETFAALAPAVTDRAILLGVRLQDPQAADVFVSRVRTAEASVLWDAYSWQAIQDFYRQDQLFNVVPVLLLGIVAVAAAAMILATIIGGAVLAQYREIAVLKALGFTGGQVLLLFVGQTLLLGLLGGVPGIAGGDSLARRTMAPLARLLGTPDVLHFQPAVAAAVLALVLAVASLFAALAAWRAVALRPAAMLAEGFAAPRARTSPAVRLLAALRLPAPVVLGVGDATARPARAAMTLLSLTVCLVTITLGLNFPGIAEQIWHHRDLIGINWDMIVQPRILTLAEAEAAVRALPDLAGYYREVFQTGVMVDRDFVLGVRAVDGDWNRFGFRLLAGRLPERPGEVLLAPRAWERLGAQLGSRFNLQVGDRTLPVAVVGKYQDQVNSGRIALMTFATLQQYGTGAAQNTFLRVKLQPGADWAAARRTLLAATQEKPLVVLEDSELPDFARDVVAMMRQLAWVMALIACLSSLGAALLTAREQMREVAIRKAIGMTPVQVLALVASGGAWFGVIAVLVALPGGFLVQKGLATVMAGVMGLDQVPLDLPGRVLALAAAIGLLLSVAAVLPAAAWGARLAPARVLHAE